MFVHVGPLFRQDLKVALSWRLKAVPTKQITRSSQLAGSGTADVDGVKLKSLYTRPPASVLEIKISVIPLKLLRSTGSKINELASWTVRFAVPSNVAPPKTCTAPIMSPIVVSLLAENVKLTELGVENCTSRMFGQFPGELEDEEGQIEFLPENGVMKLKPPTVINVAPGRTRGFGLLPVGTVEKSITSADANGASATIASATIKRQLIRIFICLLRMSEHVRN